MLTTCKRLLFSVADLFKFLYERGFMLSFFGYNYIYNAMKNLILPQDILTSVILILSKW